LQRYLDKQAKSLRVLLALPPDVHNLGIYRVTCMRPPLSPVYIGTVLEQTGHEVKTVGSPARKLRLNDRLAEVKSFSPDIVIPQLLALVTLDWASVARRALWRQPPSARPLPSVGRASGLEVTSDLLPRP